MLVGAAVGVWCSSLFGGLMGDCDDALFAAGFCGDGPVWGRDGCRCGCLDGRTSVALTTGMTGCLSRDVLACCRVCGCHSRVCFGMCWYWFAFWV